MSLSGQANASQPEASLSSSSSSISLIKLDELNSLDASKQNRLPALIKLVDLNNPGQRKLRSMPSFAVESLEQSPQPEKQQASLPVGLALNETPAATATSQDQQQEKENIAKETSITDDYQIIDPNQSDLLGPSLPPPDKAGETALSAEQRMTLGLSQLGNQVQQPSFGESLIDLVINLRSENQNLVKALETNNEFVKQRLAEFKKSQEDSKKLEAHFAMEKADNEHQIRKLQRQNQVLSERLKTMESKLKDMKLEINESLVAAHSSKASSDRDAAQKQVDDRSSMYPSLENDESFSNAALTNAPTTMQIDATNAELYNGEDDSDSAPSAPEMDTEPEPGTSTAHKIANMSQEELAKRFDANKANFYAMDVDPMKECDRLEKQLNDIGKRDYEICLLQQQLNIYRQDYRLERIANLEAKVQIEKLKNDIEKLCYERSHERACDETSPKQTHESGVRFGVAAAAAADAVGKVGHRLGRRAARSAAKAAKYAAKQAHLEEKATSLAAKAAAAQAAAASKSYGQPARQPGAGTNQPQQHDHHHHHRRHRSHHALSGLRAVKDEVVGDLLSTANKAMLTGYKMASTHVNLALDKLSEFEQAQATKLAENLPQKQQDSSQKHGPPSID